MRRLREKSTEVRLLYRIRFRRYDDTKQECETQKPSSHYSLEGSEPVFPRRDSSGGGVTEPRDNGSMHPRFPNGVRIVASLAFRLLPRSWRFGAAVRFSRLVRPVVARTNAYAARSRLMTDGLAETALDLILTELTRRGVAFDPVIEIDGIEHSPQPGDERPCLVAGAHTMLNTLYSRYLFDMAIPHGAITAEEMCYRGTRVPVDAIVPSRAFFFEVRRRLKDGVSVCGLLDRDIPERRTSEFETVNGTLIVSKALFQLALRMNVRIVFFGTRMGDDDRVVTTLRPAESSTVDGVAAEMARFVEQLVTPTPRTSRLRRSSDRTTAIRG
jgi:hypothetical protein